MNILVIEDSRFLRIAIERVLTKAGHSVSSIADGREGVRAAKANMPDLILLDMMLPELEGTGVLKQLKKDPTTKQMPIIVLTGLAKKNEQKLKDAGASAYIEKSSLNFDKNAEALVQCVDGVLKLSAVRAGPEMNK
jgi:CheY-like chemotaxis protein